MSSSGTQRPLRWEATASPPRGHREPFWRSLFYFNVYRLLVALLLLLSVAAWGTNVWFGTRNIRLFVGVDVAYVVFSIACFVLISARRHFDLQLALLEKRLDGFGELFRITRCQGLPLIEMLEQRNEVRRTLKACSRGLDTTRETVWRMPRTATPTVYLTFDDGPRPETTPAILDALAKECVQATFFMIGKRADAHPELAARVREAGHSIGSHSYTHRDLNKLEPEDAVQDIQHGYEAVEKAAFGSAAEAFCMRAWS